MTAKKAVLDLPRDSAMNCDCRRLLLRQPKSDASGSEKDGVDHVFSLDDPL